VLQLHCVHSTMLYPVWIMWAHARCFMYHTRSCEWCTYVELTVVSVCVCLPASPTTPTTPRPLSTPPPPQEPHP
jgi:hypothetical protein